MEGYSLSTVVPISREDSLDVSKIYKVKFRADNADLSGVGYSFTKVLGACLALTVNGGSEVSGSQFKRSSCLDITKRLLHGFKHELSEDVVVISTTKFLKPKMMRYNVLEVAVKTSSLVW